MRCETQDYSARRSYDTVLPEEARSELLQPRRPKILTRPPFPPQKPSWLDSVRYWWHPSIGWLLALVFLVTVVYAVSRPSPADRARALQQSTQAGLEAEAKAAEALKALRSPSPAPATVQPTPDATPSGVVPLPAPRARLVRLPAPPPRAQLVRLPQSRVRLVEFTPEHIDESHRITMP
jgi:hypothetical protein